MLDDIKSGFVPVLNRTQDDSVFLSSDAPVPDGLILSLAAGMGNIYSAALFSGICEMKLTDSKEKLLSGPEIVVQTIYNQASMQYPPEAIISAAAAETTLPKTDIVQIGNTVFIGHKGKAKQTQDGRTCVQCGPRP